MPADTPSIPNDLVDGLVETDLNVTKIVRLVEAVVRATQPNDDMLPAALLFVLVVVVIIVITSKYFCPTTAQEFCDNSNAMFQGCLTLMGLR